MQRTAQQMRAYESPEKFRMQGTVVSFTEFLDCSLGPPLVSRLLLAGGCPSRDASCESEAPHSSAGRCPFGGAKNVTHVRAPNFSRELYRMAIIRDAAHARAFAAAGQQNRNLKQVIAVKPLAVVLAAVAVVFTAGLPAAAISAVPPPPVTGGFTNADLNGTVAFSIERTVRS